ncbi:hypothetical protein PBI_WOES_86 [Gordonia phage Woes]|uniref:Uncharacterized protein n=13 Tax=Woesvirus woes TaxID=1982751 RepID=A0A482JIH2_9CAUD|nr:hypothetical protein BH793_gp27 [Gordonia phage Woes]ATW61181.1 hypothetical protein SEA_ANAMIKA_86 [Gordonia phage Anamika]AVP43270.1 hypothetical protein PBI_HAIL2PITT_85 [Gordonia phage Hail2Pitt]QAX94369.1 hypothetical protein SEA_GUILLAUME_86 [Gordonia phage Guillaume]QAX94692.1 hypothetical protein SEA_HARAMBE_86 [Gordonia phage Harambe]QAX95355.1 hypothetical protein SEA_HELLO_86 [Gordonia phage Hello]QAX95447.1 hypothetical protein SEA_NEOEVIE_86 [Gordonia phage Neoevie]QBP30363.1
MRVTRCDECGELIDPLWSWCEGAQRYLCDDCCPPDDDDFEEDD